MPQALLRPAQQGLLRPAQQFLPNWPTIANLQSANLEEENAVQAKVISQLITIVSRSRLLTKPNRHPYCEYGHRFCKIDHRRFNYVKQAADC